MIEPLQRDDAFIADVTATMARREGVSLWWLGQSGYLIAYDGVCIAVDPYLSDSLTVKYANTTKPHIRMGQRVVDPALLRMVSLVTSSHNHTDHLDGETIGLMMQANPELQIVCSQANVAFAAERLGVDTQVIREHLEPMRRELDALKQLLGFPAIHFSFGNSGVELLLDLAGSAFQAVRFDMKCSRAPGSQKPGA